MDELQTVGGTITAQPTNPDLSHGRPDHLSVPQLVDRIMALNPSASGDYLNTFRRDDLQLYLDHLVATRAPRGRGEGWIRRGDTPGIVARRAQDQGRPGAAGRY